MYKFIVVFVIVIISVAVSYFVFSPHEIDFYKLSSKEKRERIIAHRDFAIAEAVTVGDYHCCINPPCTMCYMEANKWNNHKAGTCACDDLIAQGKEACPQCERVVSDDGTAACDFIK